MRRRSTTHLTVLLLVSLPVFTSILVHTCTGIKIGSITITVSPTPIVIGQNTTISGTIGPPHEENVTIFCREIGKPPWSAIPTVKTNAAGYYSCNWTTFHMGTYEFKGYWANDTHIAESSPPYPTVNVVGVHDIAILNIVRSPTEVKVGETVGIDVTVMNEGHYSETFNVIVKYDTTVIDTHSVTLASGATIIKSFSWDTTGVDEGTYTISAEVPQVTNETDTADNTRTDGTVKVTLPKEPPIASFTYSPLSPVVDETVTFDASASSDPDGTIKNYAWIFGDGKTGTGNTTSHAYTKAGNYTAKLTVTDNDGLTNTKTKPITISPPPLQPPVANFTESAEIVYTGETIVFNASGSYDPDGNITSYFWNFGDETTKNYVKGVNLTDTTTHAYADNGTYTVTLTVTDDDGATNNATATKTVLNRSPVASFTQSAEIVYINETIVFNASGSYDPDGNITSYFWTFGDGNNATGVTTEHSYPLEGTYTVTLTVTDDDGSTNSTSASKTVLNRPPVAVFTESAETVYTGEVITFNASDSYDPDGNITSYFWNFGDETTKNYVKGVNLTDTTTHAYADNGTYTVTLTVTDDKGATGTATATKTVLNRSPMAIFIESTETAYIGEAITFNASDSYDPDGTLVSYFWDFGDETDATGAIVNHAYDINGTFTVTLTVTDDDGASNSSSSTKTILKNEPPVPLFTQSAETVYTGEIIAFNASDSYDPDGIIESYFWDFGDGTNTTGMTTEHSYADDDVYTVTLSVTDDDGETTSKSAVKMVSNRPPIASFTDNATTPLTGEIAHFDASGSNDPDGSVISYFWNFGDGTEATGVTVNHAYKDDGFYIVTLVVTDDDGETASKSAAKTVSNRPPIASFTDNATTVDIDTLIHFNASGSYDPDGSILSYFWDFSDGARVHMCVILSHIYTREGNYTVTLTVTDDDGASSSASVTITVKASSGLPLAFIAGIALCIAASTGAAVFATYRRRKKPANDDTTPKPGLS